MTCEECDFWHANGGTCRGYQKNPEAKVPFYVCPHTEDLQQIREYLAGTATKRASLLGEHHSQPPPIPCARVCSPGQNRSEYQA